MPAAFTQAGVLVDLPLENVAADRWIFFSDNCIPHDCCFLLFRLLISSFCSLKIFARSRKFPEACFSPFCCGKENLLEDI